MPSRYLPVGKCPGADLSEPTTAEAPDLRARILIAATRAFAERGYGATSIREVVEAVGCTKPALYYYFPSKADLFVEVLARPHREYASLLSDIAAREAPLREKLTELFTRLLSAVEQDPTPMRLVLTTHLRPERGQPAFDLYAAHEGAMSLMEEIITKGVAEGAIRSDLPPRLIALPMMGIFHETAMAAIHGCAPEPELVPQLIDLYLNGVKP